MPMPSVRGKELLPSPIRSLLPYALEAKKKGKKVFHLNIGQPDIPTPPEGIQAVREIDTSVLAYGPAEGLISLRDKVAEYYTRYAGELDRESVFVTTGASEAILYTLLSCLDPDDELIIPEPFYANYLGYCDAAQIRMVPLTTRFEDAFQLPAIEAFEEIISPRTAAILICNPGNPTGQLYDKESLAKLVQLAIRRNLFLIVDEVYKEFCYDTQFTSALSFEEARDHIIVIDSISKVFSSCGARIGTLITRNKAIQETVFKYAELRLSPPYLGQVLAEACYTHREPYISNAREEYRKRRSILYEGLSRIDELECYLPGAAFYNIVKLPFPDVYPFCKWLLTDFSQDNQTVMLAPADGFYFNQELGKSQVRLAYILNEEDLKRSLEVLGEAVKAYLKSH
jgi:aspartate aminotransferase